MKNSKMVINEQLYDTQISLRNMNILLHFKITPCSKRGAGSLGYDKATNHGARLRVASEGTVRKIKRRRQEQLNRNVAGSNCRRGQSWTPISYGYSRGASSVVGGRCVDHWLEPGTQTNECRTTEHPSSRDNGFVPICCDTLAGLPLEFEER